MFEPTTTLSWLLSVFEEITLNVYDVPLFIGNGGLLSNVLLVSVINHNAV
jgi:hypothetical protein